MLLGWVEVGGLGKAAVHPSHQWVCAQPHDKYTRIKRLLLIWPREKLLSFSFERFALSALLSVSLLRWKVSVLSLWATQDSVAMPVMSESECESSNQWVCSCACENICLCKSVYLCLLWCLCISSYPLIRLTVFINSLGLMCDSVTPAFLLARLPCSLATPGPNYRADDLTSDH